MTRILVSAGEPSGDLHGAPVVAALRHLLPGVAVEAFGGARIAAAGAEVLWPMEQYTVMGLAEIVAKIPAHARLLGEMRRRFRSGRYDLVILIDYPGFHLRVAEAARAAGVPVLYYIAPQLWAWRPERAARFRQAVDRFAVIFPFEVPFFRSVGLTTDFVGHPLLDRPPLPTREAARAELGIGAGDRVLALFPGSRGQELRRHWAPFRDAARRLLDAGTATRCVVAAVPGGSYPDPGPLELVDRDSGLLLRAADAVLAKSGTTTLEAALADAPMVVAYRVHRVTAWAARRLMRVPWIALPNLIAQQPVVEEIVQADVTAERLAAAVAPLLDPASAATVAQRAGLARIRDLLGGPGAAERVAAVAATMLR
ncbi:MAG: lipid-A-disaccharide synthase [Gemmatimonadales bacterium]